MQSCLLKAYLDKNERDSFGIINDHMHYQKCFSSSGNWSADHGDLSPIKTLWVLYFHTKFLNKNEAVS